MAEGGPPPCIYVLAGTNGAGKSSLLGAIIERQGAAFFNPDAAARQIRGRNPGISQTEANSAAWHEGRRLLERAIRRRLTHAFETTLGGATMTALLERALAAGLEVRAWYVGLTSPELHVARVRQRVARGGHDIPEADIRRRFHDGRLNLVRLLPRLTELRVYDNSEEADPHTGATPSPVLLLHLVRGRIAASCPLAHTPQWAKPILAAALKVSGA